MLCSFLFPCPFFFVYIYVPTKFMMTMVCFIVNYLFNLVYIKNMYVKLFL